MEIQNVSTCILINPHKDVSEIKYTQKTIERYLVISISSIQYIEDIQICGMNMPFISSSEAKNAYFMSGEAPNEINIFSLHEMK